MILLLVSTVFIFKSVLAFNDSVSLTELDKRLTNLLLNPESGKGAVLLSDGYVLYTNLDDIADMIEAKDPRGLKIYNEIESEGGIQFYKTVYDPDKVRYTYEYNPDDNEMLIATLGGIENTWKNIQEMLNITKSEVSHATANPITQW